MGLATVRGLSVMAGLGAVALAAAVHPLAGLALATHTIHAKYSSQGYLESLPTLWMALAMLLVASSARRRGPRLVAGRRVLGCCAAGKWLHGFPGLALLFIPGWRVRARVVLDRDRRMDSPGSNHVERTHRLRAAEDRTSPGVRRGTHHSDNVDGPSPESGLGWAGTLAPGGVPREPGPSLGWLAVVSLWRARREAFSRYLLAWMAVPLAVMMFWGTRWPQHTMVLVMPLCLSPASLGRGLRTLALSAQSERDVVPPHWRQPDQNFPSRSPRCPR